MVGHVDHGKTKLTQALSGTWTEPTPRKGRGDQHQTGICGYLFPRTKEGEHYAKGKHPDGDKGKGDLLRVVSFVDAPGHETLMAV
ncbi:MAG: hypothetical protein Ct9H90mP24_7620 [Methanobacteriota archaeon]|nr:MAG: hypothetical protein Ct9H90mP24_7620 [Euryarchaeota archaeon]